MNKIVEAFNELHKDHTYANATKFSNFVTSLDNDTILESFQYLLAEPLAGARTASMFLTANNVKRDHLERIDNILESGLSKSDILDTSIESNKIYVECLETCQRLVKAKLEQSDITISLSDAVLESSLGQVFSKNKEKDVEDYILSVVGENLPTATRVKNLEKLSKSIEAKMVPINCVRLLSAVGVGTTAILYSFFVAIPLAVLTPVIMLPITIATVVADKQVKKSVKKIYTNTLMSELKKVEAAIIAGNSNQEIKQYKENLESAIDIIQSGELSALESVIENVTFKEENFHSDYDVLEEAFDEVCLSFFLSESTVDEDMVSINNMIKLHNALNLLESTQGEIILEGKTANKARKAINKASHSVTKGVSKLKAKANDGKQAVDAAKGAVKRAEKDIDDRATRSVQKAKSIYRNDVRDNIIEDKTTLKLSRLFKKAVGLGTLTVVNPLLGAIGLATSMALKKNVKEKERRKILRELEEELEIVNEKIEDSRGDENKEKKYQLMRIRNKLTKDIERIKYRLKADDRGV